MQIDIKFDPSCAEPRLTITAATMTEEVSDILKKLSQDVPQMIAGSRNDEFEVLEPASIVRIYAGQGKVYAETGKGRYVLRLRLYELEERLDKWKFARISNSEIINLRQVESFDLSLAGTIYVKLTGGATTYVSRRYVARIKRLLGV